MKFRSFLINLALISFSALCGVGCWTLWQIGPARQLPVSAIGKEPGGGGPIRLDMKKLNAVLPVTPTPSLVLFLESACGFCKRSLPLYHDLAGNPAVRSGKVQIVAILPDSKEDSEKYLGENKLSVQRLIHDLVLASVGVQGTPTVALIKDGKLLNQ